jgi:hypothetical protein
MADLHEMIDVFTAAKSAYVDDATVEDEGPEWEAYEVAEHALIVFPCETIEDVRLKARFFIENAGPNDTLRNCFSESGYTLDLFLRSLTPPYASNA